MGLFDKKVVTQNDIAKIIKSQIEFSDEVVNVILKSKIVKKDTDIARINKKMNDLKNTLGLLFGRGGIFETLNSIAASLDVVENIKNMKLRPYKKALKKLFKLMSSIISYSLRISLQYKGLLIAIPALLATHIIINNWAGIMFTLDKVAKINSVRIRMKIRGWHRILKMLYYGDDNDGKSKRKPSFLKHLELFSIAVLEQLKWGQVIKALGILVVIFAELFAVMYTISKTPTVVIIPKLMMMKLDINYMTKFLIGLNDKVEEIRGIVKFKEITFNLLKIILIFLLIKSLFTIVTGMGVSAMLVLLVAPIIALAVSSVFGLYHLMLLFKKINKKEAIVASEKIQLLIGLLTAITVSILPIINPLKKITEGGGEALSGLGYLALFIVSMLTTLLVLKYIYKKIFEKHTEEIKKSTIAIKLVILEFAALSNAVIPLIDYFDKVNKGAKTLIIGLGCISVFIISMLSTLLALKYIYKKIFEKHKEEIESSMGHIKSLVFKMAALMTEIVVVIKLGEQLNKGFKTLMISLGLMPVIILAVYGVSMSLLYMDRKVFRKYYRPILLALKRINILLSSFIVIITAVAAMAVVALKITEKPDMLLGIFAAIMLIVVGILGVSIVISKMIKVISTKQLLISISHIILIASALIIIELELLLFAAIAQEMIDKKDAINQALLSLIVFIAEIVVIGAIAAILAPAAKPALIAIGALAVLVGAIFLIAWMLTGLAELHIDEDTIKLKIDIVVRCVLYVFESIFNNMIGTQGQETPSFLESIMNTYLKTYQAFTGAILLIMAVVAVFCILLIAGMLRLVQEIELDEKKIYNTVSSSIHTVNTILAMIFKPISFKQDTSSTQGYVSVLEYGAGDNNSILMVLKALLGAVYLIFTFVAVTMILLISLELKLLEKVNLDNGSIIQNTNKIIECARNVMDSIFSPAKPNDPKESDQPWHKDVLNWFGDFFGAIGKVVMAILSVIYLAMTTVAVGLLFLLAKCLSFIQTIELDPTTIQSKVKDIMDTAHFTIKAIVDYKKPKSNETTSEEKSIWQKCLDALIPDGLKGILDAIMAVGQLAILLGVIFLIKQLADSLNTIQSFALDANINQKVTNIVSAANKVYDAVATNNGKELSFDTIKNADKKAAVIEDVLESIADFSKEVNESKFVKATDAYCKFMDKLNGVDLVKLQTTEKLFYNMAKFSESIHGNFDKLADSLNEKIAPLLEKLEKGVADLNKDMNNNAKDQLKSNIELSNGGASTDSINKASGGDQNTATELQKAQAKKNEKDKKKYQGMQDIMDILLGQGGHKGVKIHK